MDSTDRLRVLPIAKIPEPLLKAFPDCDDTTLFSADEPWPELRCCLCILCASRSGSTYLCREIESRFAVGLLGETLGPPSLSAIAEKKALRSAGAAIRAAIETSSEDGAFGVKLNVPTLVTAELSGFISQYMGKTGFILLLRRNLVAQAVSLAKAEITQRYHFRQAAKKSALPEDYSRERIFKNMRNIANGIRIVSEYAATSGRPYEKVYYEDFENGDFSAVESACRRLGVPERANRESNNLREVRRISDEINTDWHDRFCAEADDRTKDLLAQYDALL